MVWIIKDHLYKGMNFLKSHQIFSLNDYKHLLTERGSFQFNMSKTVNRGKDCLVVYCRLEIAQNSHDVKLLDGIKQFFEGGYLKPKYDIMDIHLVKSSRSVNRYVNTDTLAVISFVDKYPMYTRKHLDYLDWKRLVALIKEKAHPSEEGRLVMLKVKAGMNANRSSLVGDTTSNYKIAKPTIMPSLSLVFK